MISWVLCCLLLHVIRRQGWRAHFRPLKCQADFHPQIRIPWLPNRRPAKLKGCFFFSWHLIEDPFKIQVLIAEQFLRNVAFEATSIHRWDFVCQGAKVTLFAPHSLDDAQQCIQRGANSVTGAQPQPLRIIFLTFSITCLCTIP